MHAYAKAARYPHGSVVGQVGTPLAFNGHATSAARYLDHEEALVWWLQDFFESRVLAMDTDFRMFSAQHHGNLPGIDLAYILDGAAYHTERDTVARIRKGTVQVRDSE